MEGYICNEPSWSQALVPQALHRERGLVFRVRVEQRPSSAPGDNGLSFPGQFLSEPAPRAGHTDGAGAAGGADRPRSAGDSRKAGEARLARSVVRGTRVTGQPKRKRKFTLL